MIQYIEEFDNLFRLPYEENINQGTNVDDFFSRFNMEYRINDDFEVLCNPILAQEEKIVQDNNENWGNFHKETESVFNHPEHFDLEVELKNNLKVEEKKPSVKSQTPSTINSNQDSITSRKLSEEKEESVEFDNILDDLLGEKEIRLHKRLTYAKQQELKQIFKNYPNKISKSARIRVAEETGLTQRQVYNYYYKLQKDGEICWNKKSKAQWRSKRI